MNFLMILTCKSEPREEEREKERVSGKKEFN